MCAAKYARPKGPKPHQGERLLSALILSKSTLSKKSTSTSQATIDGGQNNLSEAVTQTVTSTRQGGTHKKAISRHLRLAPQKEVRGQQQNWATRAESKMFRLLDPMSAHVSKHRRASLECHFWARHGQSISRRSRAVTSASSPRQEACRRALAALFLSLCDCSRYHLAVQVSVSSAQLQVAFIFSDSQVIRFGPAVLLTMEVVDLGSTRRTLAPITTYRDLRTKRENP